MGLTSLAGRRIIITGGASGMGEGLVRAFPGLGAEVASLDREAFAGAAVASEAGATFVAMDVCDPSSVNAAFDTAVSSLGGLDVLVHAAGIAPASPAATTPLELWEAVQRTNATGTVLANQAAFRHLESGGGTILNFASGAGVKGYPGKAAYAASKGAVLAWTRTIAVEWAPYRITANAIVPAIWTPMYDKTRSEMSTEQLAAHDAHMAKAMPLGGRLGDIQRDFVPVMAFYASAGAGYLTGQTFVIDGGMTMLS
jgi:NAD(P)-dependent dehydrogenase (short-subunit alcohol dehydrogenase family)